ncbi:copper resistance CopC family protein [Gordonia sp. CPCC 205515]|uniref:copper resistance CopC family protein n=1 Tax=Gordonia sp. CPCC 205515 TaxID=3140791 RepID=UPI003AF38A12
MRNRRLGLLAVVSLMVAGILATIAAPVASAHSQLESSDPANGAQLSTAPTRVSLTFNEAIQESFDVLNVVGPDNHYWHEGDPTVTGPTISVGLRELGPAGKYVINYRVTSADGHPVSGQRTFEMTTAGSGTPGPAVDAAQSSSDDGPPLWPFIVGALVILAGGLGVVLWWSRRPRAH